MAQSPSNVVQIETNLDDASGEVVGAAMEALLAAGALDCWAAPIIMKKGRPGLTLAVLCEPAKRDALARLMIELTGSFGVRFGERERLVLDRRHETVETPYGKLRVKIGSLDGKIVAAKAEFDDARRAAEQHGVAVRQVLDAVEAAAWTRFPRQGGRP